ncbi:TetR/AcrR family transcriptional regulator [Sporomusa sp.]|uniref:TetR/AcrR family transcriptional regulator n=1 Tax=Sporomusa sp. TaxID=2078658 RepID=UPI002BDF3A2E|nr:TetR/AcrR family transcriptional regulator [Sporomusa sp.]HWR44015.1 TetR/AcrR family transcriptional regulator [Sporomusa sp.]
MTAIKLKEIALRHFAENGYEGASLADIANEIGIKKPSIYAHYASKMELFAAITEDEKVCYCSLWEEALISSESLPTDQRLSALFSIVSGYFAGDRVKMAFWVRLWMFPPQEEAESILQSLKKMNAPYINQLAAIISQGIEQKIFRPCPPLEVAHAFFCLLDGYLMRAICYQGFDYKQSLPHIWSTFLLGIKL